MKPKIKRHQAITIHRDHSVSYFSTYRQVWDRTSAASLATRHDDFSALSAGDRSRIMLAASTV